MKRYPILAIDGPAGTGKTTSAAETARLLGFAYLDSGALYRAIAFAAREIGIENEDDTRLHDLLSELPVYIETDRTRFSVNLDGTDITEKLRDPDVTSLSSKLAVLESVRERVNLWLRELASRGPSVIEGRDIGTAVFPDAELKIFLTASLEERARRRTLELERKGEPADLETITRRLAERDERDSGRGIAPLTCAPDAVVVDTTDTDIDGQVSMIIAEWGRVHPPRVRSSYAFEQAMIRTFARVCLGLTVEGHENVPRAGGLILISNHKSYFDPPVLGSVLPREVHYLAKKELFEVPFLKHWIRANNAIPIDRHKYDRAAIERCLDILGRGRSLLIFPEGTRILKEGLGESQLGVAWIAARARVPIVPIHHRGLWAAERKWFKRGIARIRIGEPFRLPPVPQGREGRAQYPAIADRMMEAISSLAGP